MPDASRSNTQDSPLGVDARVITQIKCHAPWPSTEAINVLVVGNVRDLYAYLKNPQGFPEDLKVHVSHDNELYQSELYVDLLINTRHTDTLERLTPQQLVLNWYAEAGELRLNCSLNGVFYLSEPLQPDLLLDDYQDLMRLLTDLEALLEYAQENGPNVVFERLTLLNHTDEDARELTVVRHKQENLDFALREAPEFRSCDFTFEVHYSVPFNPELPELLSEMYLNFLQYKYNEDRLLENRTLN